MALPKFHIFEIKIVSNIKLIKKRKIDDKK